jgi:hypothetical protein
MAVIGLLLSSACTTSTPQPTQAAYPPAGVPAPAYPAGATPGGAYPSAATLPPQDTNPYPGQPTVLPTVIPTVTPTYDPTNFGIIHGRLLEAGKPVGNTLIFLADIKKDANGAELVAAFSPLDSVRVITTDNGDFTFMNVPAGRYAVILYTGVSAFLITYPGKTDPILFTVEAGKTAELGELNYDDLPLD